MRMTQRGQAMMLAYVAVLFVSVVGGAFLTRGFTVQRVADHQQQADTAFYEAEGALEDALGRFAQAIANFQVDANTARYPVTAGTTLTTAFASGDAATSWVAEAEAAPRAVVDPDGTTIFVKNYQITATAGGITLHQVVARRIIYTFQHAIFYDQDLEWLPGPNMTLSGRIHGNRDIYIGSGSLLTVDSQYLRSAGNIYNRRKDTTPPGNGIVQIRVAGSNPAQYVAMAGLDSSSPTWATAAITRWNGTVQSAVHGVTKRSVPVVGSTAPGGFYDTNADVKVVNGTITKGGVPLVQGVDIPPGTITTSTTFYNNREEKFVRMTDIDLRRLGGYYDANNDGTLDPPGFPGNPYTSKLPSNGLLYATRDDAPASQQPGIRLRNGSLINRSGGVTVVSNDPVYVQGDFNTTSKKPVAVIGDALNLLSNNWNDANSTVNNVNSGSPRTATNTTYNSAFIAGITTTSGAEYNGGLENYPRFHERWTSRTLTIQGSFVSLWNSQMATGDWEYGQQSSHSQYTAPTRNWSYDQSFSSGTSMPPFTPWAVEITKGAWWKD